MHRSELFFKLPPELIAQKPAEPRDSCRLMVLDRTDKTIGHDRFFNLPEYFRPGDVLVFNQSKVLPARLLGKRGESDREVLLLRDLGDGQWEVLVGGKVSAGDQIVFSRGLSCTVLRRLDSTFVVAFDTDGPDFLRIVEQIGHAPTPPYIKEALGDPTLYQTVFAREPGSAAAPTAGLHFTQPLLDRLTDMGVEQLFVTLHVGLGTFQPVKAERVEEHKIHTEQYSVDRETFDRLCQARREGRRIIAVGTTSVRVLETIFSVDEPRLSGETGIFIYPGYRFKAVDAMITNFHTPYSSLLALVYAFAGQDFIRKAYDEAVAQKYRFFSFGDAMLIRS